MRRLASIEVRAQGFRRSIGPMSFCSLVVTCGRWLSLKIASRSHGGGAKAPSPVLSFPQMFVGSNSHERMAWTDLCRTSATSDCSRDSADARRSAIGLIASFSYFPPPTSWLVRVKFSASTVQPITGEVMLSLGMNLLDCA